MFYSNTKSYKCKYCGKKIYSTEFTPKLDKSQLVCGECAYWNNLINTPNQYIEVINYTAFEFLPYQEPGLGKILGETMYILRKNGEVAMSNDVWEKGKIPDRFLSYFPNTAYAISKKIYRKLSKGKMGCWAKGCFDRYHCYRYDYKKEIGKEPYNIVPKDWTVGNEHCPAFINILDIKGLEFFDINDIL